MVSLLDKARQQYNRGDFKIALATLRRLIGQDRRNAGAYILAATIHEQQGDRMQAGIFYDAAMDLSPALKKELAFRAAGHFLAVDAQDRALASLMTFHSAHPEDLDGLHSICSILREQSRYEEALPCALKLAERGHGFANWLNAGIVLNGLGLFDQALPQLQKAHAENPGERLALSELFWCAANLCDLPLSDACQASLQEAYVRDGQYPDIRESAFRALMWSGDEAYLARVSARTAEVVMAGQGPVRQQVLQTPRANPKIRIGYVSSDFYDHATMTLLAGVLEAHDRSRFEIYGFCHTPERFRHGRMRARFLAACDHVVDLLALEDDQAAAEIAGCRIDILVDLKGFTQGSRPGIFRRRPAPVQVTWLGFPGSVAHTGIDYALTDSIVTPPSSQPFYTETLLPLPGSYQCNDARREPVTRQGPRAAHGLPEEAPEGSIVFCSFNNAPKIRTPMFSAWMQILAAVEQSVLWLGLANETVRHNLRMAAARAGIDPARLVFADIVPVEDHLRRLPQADIALDTAPCNGHTTTSDALWAGVPVITLRGTSFAGRVSESLLTAVGLGELVAQDINAYIAAAIGLARDPQQRKAVHRHLLHARNTSSLFDPLLKARHLETMLARLPGLSASDAQNVIVQQV